MGIADIISAALGALTNIMNSKNQTILADKQLQMSAQQASQHLADLQAQVESKQLDFQIALSNDQAAQDKIDEASSDKYQARWHATIGWVCAIGLGMNYILVPVLKSLLSLSLACGASPTMVMAAINAMPSIATGDLLGLLAPMLGLGAYTAMTKK